MEDWAVERYARLVTSASLPRPERSKKAQKGAKAMFYGIAAGATWAVETIILGIALSMAPFVSTEQAISSFVSTFIHDAFSALWATLYYITACAATPQKCL